MSAPLPEIGTLWIGGALGPIERLCLASMVANGHRVTLYSYVPDPEGLPAGVEVADAAQILPAREIFTYKKTGSYATFADWFRIEMIARTGKVWLDTDIALMRPFDSPEAYFFLGGPHRNYGEMVNNCVLKYPSDSDLARALCGYFAHPARLLRFVPWHSAVRLTLRRALSGHWALSRFRWGAFGMAVLKRETTRLNLGAYVHHDPARFIEGAENIMAANSAATVDPARIEMLHFITSGVRRQGFDPARPEPGSLYELALRRYGL